MDKQHMLSLQPPLAKAYLYGRGMFRLLPSPAFFLLGQCLGLALLEGALAGMDPCISKKALFLAVSIAPLLATLGLSRWGPPPLAHLPTRLHYFAAPFLSYGAAGVAIHQWGWGAPAIPECSMENFPPH